MKCHSCGHPMVELDSFKDDAGIPCLTYECPLCGMFRGIKK